MMARLVFVRIVLAGVVMTLVPAVQAQFRESSSTHPVTTGLYGCAIAHVPDTDGDGVDDWVVGARLEEDDFKALDMGRAYLVSGAWGGTLRTFESPLAEDHGQFGYAVAGAGDVNDDGYGEVIIGAPGEEQGMLGGRAYVFDGHTGDVLFVLVSPTPSVNGQFGAAVAGAADLNADGTPDFLVGAYGEAQDLTGAGHVHAYSGVSGAHFRTYLSPNVQTNGGFGAAAVAVDDLTGDTRDELLVGAPGETVGQPFAGRAYLLNGATGGLIRTYTSAVPQAYGLFGSAVNTVPDVTGDGVTELVVGAYLETSGGVGTAGRAYLFRTSSSVPLAALGSPNPTAGGSFGSAVAGLDFDGDGEGEVLIGAAGETHLGLSAAGRAYVFDEDGSVLAQVGSPYAETGGAFGIAVAALPDIHGDGTDEMLLGAQNEDPGALPSAAGMAYFVASYRTYVDGALMYPGFGARWDEAYDNLHAPCYVAAQNPGLIREIWVTAGTYQAGYESPFETFALPADVAVSGGFAGGETSIEQRDIALHETILDGDVNGDDGPGFANYGDNVYHVVTVAAENTVLDGVTIRGGHAVGGGLNQNHGGGVLVTGGSVALRTCTLKENKASGWGGAVCVGIYGDDDPAAEITENCLFQDNQASSGAAVFLYSSDTTAFFDTSSFFANTATSSGGAIRANGPAVIDTCYFAGNEAALLGGALDVSGGPLTVVGTDFAANYAIEGGAVSASGGWLTLAECVFLQNVAADKGGALRLIGGNSYLTYCDFLQDYAATGAELYAEAPVDEGRRAGRNDMVSMANVTFWDNFAVVEDHTRVEALEVLLFGPVVLGAGTHTLASVTVDDDEPNLPGDLQLADGAVLVIDESAATPGEPTVIDVAIHGVGDVVVTPAADCTVTAAGSIDLSGQPPGGDCLSGTDPDDLGNLMISGEVRLVGGVLQNTDVTVDNELTVESCGNGVGGRLIPSSGALVQCNHITSYSDRYMDFDPAASPKPVQLENRFHVIITGVPEGDAGELLQPRSEAVDDCGEPFEDPWTLETLHLLPNTRVNLIARAGFDQYGPPEAVLVRNLILESGAVLNTAFTQLCYETLEQAPGAEILAGVPLLGFSLENIALDDDCEFAVRVRVDDGDAGWIERVDEPPFSGLPPIPPGAGGIMHMQCYGDEPVRAAGQFSPNVEDQVMVAFEYLFVANPDAELWVYVSTSHQPGAQRVLVSKIFAPPAGYPGSIGSGAMAEFFGIFPTAGLDFRLGTYVELELHGTGSIAWINDWDPQVICVSPGQCGDFDAFGDITSADFLYVLGEYGEALDPEGDNNWCIDRISGDNFIDLGDLLTWDTVYSDPWVLNLCEEGGFVLAPRGPRGTPVPVPPEHVVIAGKPAGFAPSGLLQEDFLFTLDPATLACAGDRLDPASTPGNMGYRGNGRLAANHAGRLHQLHSVQGIVRLDDGQAVFVPPADPLPGVDAQGNEVAVRIGVSVVEGTALGTPILDLAFHPAPSSGTPLIYVTPVLVAAPTGSMYLATARLSGAGSPPTWVVDRVYGWDPAEDPLGHTEPPGSSVVDVQRLREVEVDSAGNVFVLAAQAFNENNWLLVYDEDGAETRWSLTELFDPGMVAPLALHLSGDESQLYFASGVAVPGATSTLVYRLNVVRAPDSTVENITPAGPVLINNMRSVVDILERPADGHVVVLGVTAPAFSDTKVFTEFDEVFTTPKIAHFAPTASTATASTLVCHDLALPFSAALSPPPITQGDLNCDGLADIHDINPFVLALSNPVAYRVAFPECNLMNADINGDDFADIYDINPFVVLLATGGG